jgi:hypothetical protein
MTNVVTMLQPDGLDRLAAKINSEQEAAFDSGLDALEHFAKCGHLLLQAKELVAHGEWMPWLATTEVGQRQSNAYMRLAEHWDEIAPKISGASANLGLDSALKLIAKPKSKPTQDLPPVPETEPQDDPHLKLPTQEEADESYEATLYDQACLLLESMADETRRKLFAHIMEKYSGYIKNYTT